MTQDKQLSQLTRLGLFDSRAPRYTSYPPAPHFTTHIQRDTHARWLGSIAPGSSVSLYLHIPFCRRLCWFCACRTQGINSDDPVNSYVDTLMHEVDLVARALPDNVTLSRLHWGGGTPTILSPGRIDTLADRISAVLPFGKDAEFSVEIDPSEIDDARLDAFAAAGMNRASIGVQDFNPDIQASIGRQQSFEITEIAAKKLRERGIHSLNADILYGLPDQDVASISQTCRQLISLSPDRIALYGYAHVPWMAKRQTMIPEDRLPRGFARLDLYNAARDLLVAAGYTAIGIDHFARPDDGLNVASRNARLHRNFQGYTDDACETLIGLGASAISRFAQGFTQNISATAGYLAQIRSDQLATARGHEFSGDDIFRARIIECLMCNFEVDLDQVEHEVHISDHDLRPLLAIVAKKYAPFINLSGSRLEILPQGRPLARMIAREFDTYTLDMNLHSPAI